MLGKNRNTIARWIRSGKLPATPLGNTVLIREEDVERLIPEGSLSQRGVELMEGLVYTKQEAAEGD